MQVPVSGTSTRPRALRQRSRGPGAYAAYRAGAIKLEDVAGWSHSAKWGRTPRVKSLRELVGAEEARKWTQRAVVQRTAADAISRLDDPRQVLKIGTIRTSILENVTDAVTDQVVLTGERRQHYLAQHPEIRTHEAALASLVNDPDEIQRNKSDVQMLIFYRRLDAERFLRAAVWVSRRSDKQNSIHSFRLAKASEVEMGRVQGRGIWRQKK